MDHTVLELDAEEEKNSHLLHYDPIFWGYFEALRLLLGYYYVVIRLLLCYFGFSLGLLWM